MKNMTSGAGVGCVLMSAVILWGDVLTCDVILCQEKKEGTKRDLCYCDLQSLCVRG